MKLNYSQTKFTKHMRKQGTLNQEKQQNRKGRMKLQILQ